MVTPPCRKMMLLTQRWKAGYSPFVRNSSAETYFTPLPLLLQGALTTALPHFITYSLTRAKLSAYTTSCCRCSAAHWRLLIARILSNTSSVGSMISGKPIRSSSPFRLKSHPQGCTQSINSVLSRCSSCSLVINSTFSIRCSPKWRTLSRALSMSSTSTKSP